jgi:hypothetical protein
MPEVGWTDFSSKGTRRRLWTCYRLVLADFAALQNVSWLRERHGHKTLDQICAEQMALKPKPPWGSNWQRHRRKALLQT